MDKVLHPFPPLYDADCTCLLLGTMPSPASRLNMFYYGHPRNRFWKVLAGVFGEPEPHTIDEKRTLALRNKIALWDVLAQCEIKGAADESITNPVCNDFSKLLNETHITKIYTNGAQAYKLYTKHCRTQTGIDAVPLPSTSPANAQCSLQDLIARYTVIR